MAQNSKQMSSSNYTLITKILMLIFIFASIDIEVVRGLQSTVLADLKQVERAPSRISNKVKRAQEVVMFGNQQNKLSEHNYVRADKRDIPNIPVPDVQNNIENDEAEEPIGYETVEILPPYQQLPLRARYYYDRPDIYDMEMYEDRQKRNIHKRSASKRNDRIFRSYGTDNNRIKRESTIDADELLKLLAIWEAEQHLKHQTESRPIGRPIQPEYDIYANEGFNEVEPEDVENEGTWLDEPLFPHHYNVKPRFYPPYNNIPNRQTRRYSSDDYSRVLSQLAYDNRQTNQRSPLQRRNL